MLAPTVDLSILAVATAGAGFLYRGIEIKMDAAGTSFSLTIPDHPLLGWVGLDSLVTTKKLVDAWLDRTKGTSLMAFNSGEINEALIADSSRAPVATT